MKPAKTLLRCTARETVKYDDDFFIQLWFVKTMAYHNKGAVDLNLTSRWSNFGGTFLGTSDVSSSVTPQSIMSVSMVNTIIGLHQQAARLRTDLVCLRQLHDTSVHSVQSLANELSDKVKVNVCKFPLFQCIWRHLPVCVFDGIQVGELSCDVLDLVRHRWKKENVLNAGNSWVLIVRNLTACAWLSRSWRRCVSQSSFQFLCSENKHRREWLTGRRSTLTSVRSELTMA
jgi:hypothetical protein